MDLPNSPPSSFGSPFPRTAMYPIGGTPTIAGFFGGMQNSLHSFLQSIGMALVRTIVCFI